MGTHWFHKAAKRKGARGGEGGEGRKEKRGMVEKKGEGRGGKGKGSEGTGRDSYSRDDLPFDLGNSTLRVAF